MSTVQDNKLITEEFLENAKTMDDSVDTTRPEKRSEESEKMILDEVTNEKGPIPNLSSDSNKSEENSEETESTRDQNSCERDGSNLPQPEEWQDILGKIATKNQLN